MRKNVNGNAYNVEKTPEGEYKYRTSTSIDALEASDHAGRSGEMENTAKH